MKKEYQLTAIAEMRQILRCYDHWQVQFTAEGQMLRQTLDDTRRLADLLKAILQEDDS